MTELHRASLRALYSHFEHQRPGAHATTLCRLVRSGCTDLGTAIRDHVLGDEWMDFAYSSLAEHFCCARGVLYLAASHDHPGLIKLGKTRLCAERRMRSLSRENVVHSFALLHSQSVHDRHWLERRSHACLQRQGVLRIKEFFSATAAQMRSAIAACAESDRQLFCAQGFAGALPKDLP